MQMIGSRQLRPKSSGKNCVGRVFLIACMVFALGTGPSIGADLVAYEVVDDTIPQPLTKQPGDPSSGRDVYVDRDRGHCLLCHQAASVSEPFPGTIGPDLSDVGARYTAAQLRYRIVDPTRLNADTVMPSYYRIDGLAQVEKKYEGKPVLTAQEVEDLIAFLQTFGKE